MMKQSDLFTKTRRDAPADETSTSAKLLFRAGFIQKELAGVYSMLPLGLRVMNKITSIIRQEMNNLGGQEVSLTVLQDPEVWKKTDRWDDQRVDNWFKTKLKNETVIGLGFTHEEALTRIMKNYVASFRELPKFVYQIQTKFRNELRAKSGLLRGREFLMKDLYSFTATTEELDQFYDRVADAYERIFQAVGIGDVTFRTFASGGVFSKYSHEFQTITPAGEDTIFLSRKKKIAVNKEVLTDEVLDQLGLQRADLEEVTAVEVGNIFKLGIRYSEPLGLTYTDQKGKAHPVIMGSYGIGVGRLLATIIEVHHDEKGMVWPAAVAPFDDHVIEINPKGDKKIRAESDKLVIKLEKAGRVVLFDDRALTAGQKFADSDLIGIPRRIVISEKTLAAKKVEVKLRSDSTARLLASGQL